MESIILSWNRPERPKNGQSPKKGGFEIEVVIRISGRGKIGADGMAIWYTTDGAPTQQVIGIRNLAYNSKLWEISIEHTDKQNTWVLG